MPVTNGILIFTPAALTGPLLPTMVFGASGPVAGECDEDFASDVSLAAFV